jgi:hypothetical protein
MKFQGKLRKSLIFNSLLIIQNLKKQSNGWQKPELMNNNNNVVLGLISIQSIILKII